MLISPRHPRRPSRLRSIAFLCALGLSLAGASAAAPTLGFLEHFPGTSIQGWDGGAIESNPGTDGFLGAADGYLRFSTPNGAQHNLGVRSIGAEYLGNWSTAGITQVRFWIRDVGADDPLEIHFSIGGFTNLWQYDAAFLPPTDAWMECVVDLTSSAGWTHVIGTTTTFAQALQNVEVIHVRHDNAPFVQTPDALDGDVGLDRILLTNGLLGVAPGGPAGPRALRLAPPSPNPSRGDVTLSLEVFDAAPVRVEIVDASGRLVRRNVLAAGTVGLRTWTWDGLDAAGRRAPPGYYRVRATGPSGGMSRGLVRVE